VVNSQWVKIAIADNGNGIPESIETQIFNPFCTTKPVGKGTGMALSYQIVTGKHGGRSGLFNTRSRNRVCDLYFCSALGVDHAESFGIINV